MKILFFDTETTGLPKDWKAPASDTDNWPRMIQLAFLVYATNEATGAFEKVAAFNGIIKPEGFEIPEEVSKIHGITQARAIEEGCHLPYVLEDILTALREADIVVGHNIAFDRKILGAEFHRAGLEDALEGKTKSCTMMASTKFCNLPGNRGPKWPKLQELHNKLFGANFEDAHDAAADIAATASCYFELIKIGVMLPPAQEIAKHMENKAARDAREAVNQ